MPLSVKLLTTGLTFKAAQKGYQQLQKAQGRIMVRAVNTAAFAARKGLIEEAGRVFRGPTAFIARSSWIVLKAREAGGGKKSRALIVPKQQKGDKNPNRRRDIFETQTEGGSRGIKPFEAKLANSGRGLPRGSILVPTSALKLNKNGNIPRAKLRSLIDGVANGSVLIGQLGDRSPHGVWQVARRGKRIRPVLLLIAKRSNRYRRRFKLESGIEAARKAFPKALQEEQRKAVQRALKVR